MAGDTFSSKAIGGRITTQNVRVDRSMTAGAISGVEAIDKALKEFEKKVSRKVIKSAMTKTAAMFRKEVRKRTPKGKTGNLRKSVTSKVKRFGSFKTPMLLGSVYYSREKGKKGFHAHLLELGTEERIIKDFRGLKKSGYRKRAKRQSVGRIKPTKMAATGFEVGTPKALRTWRRALVKQLRKVKAVN